MCSSDTSCVLLVLTVLEGGKLSPCLCARIFILLSHLISSLNRLSSNSFSFFIINVTAEILNASLFLVLSLKLFKSAFVHVFSLVITSSC